MLCSTGLIRLSGTPPEYIGLDFFGSPFQIFNTVLPCTKFPHKMDIHSFRVGLTDLFRIIAMIFLLERMIMGKIGFPLINFVSLVAAQSN